VTARKAMVLQTVVEVDREMRIHVIAASPQGFTEFLTIDWDADCN
jgi:hypothetical protein